MRGSELGEIVLAVALCMAVGLPGCSSDSDLIDDCPTAEKAAEGAACSRNLGTCGGCNDSPQYGPCGCLHVTCVDGKLVKSGYLGSCYDGGGPEAGKDGNPEAESKIIRDCQGAIGAPEGSPCDPKVGHCGECNDNELYWGGLCGCKGLRCIDGKISYYDATFPCTFPDAGEPEAGEDGSLDVEVGTPEAGEDGSVDVETSEANADVSSDTISE